MSTTSPHDINRSNRSRRSAVGIGTLSAALAVVVASAGLSGSTPAAADVSNGDRPVFVPIAPCRLVDTRPAPNNVQLPPRPVVAEETVTIAASNGQGDCTGQSMIPPDATALSMNVTALNATEQTFLTFWGDGANPGTANLNPSPGQPPTPNAVNTPLSPTGTFELFNERGSVDVVIDVNGYFAHHDHDDLYPRIGDVYAKSDSDSRYAPAGESYPKADADGRFAQIGDSYSKDDADDRFAPVIHDHPEFVGYPELFAAVDEAQPRSIGTAPTSCTANGTLASGDFAPCPASLTFTTTESYHVVLSVTTGWSTENTSNSAGRCRVTHNGSAIAGSDFAMGEAVDTTDAPDFLARASSVITHEVDIPVTPIPGISIETFQVECREISGDMDWAEMRLHALVIGAANPFAPI